MTTRVAVIDYGMGNLHSVASALTCAGADEVVVSNDPKAIAAADHVVFPGVGAIRDCMHEIRRLGCDQLLKSALDDPDKRVLAICVGMQALMTHSEENNGVDTLNLIPGQVRYFGAHHQTADGERLKVPHMGWNQVTQVVPHALWDGIEDQTRFYFVHSYYVDPDDDAVVCGRFDYGVNACAALARDNLFAVQFHPEKSHTPGLRLLSNFLAWDGSC
ncbi:imidazole glycerol phosphate synthase, glutamine amidotransferase subunit [Luminiphilus syltensis NOR5-1B]|uniref:Imidazole glycerol phosphate synthase subunit HisH n=1 Tax=Luminiphilus syltensis NOR5-1B TaxID=565045 RepID=B8KUN3_9GAMM|nr:imidazole glycerol phosphate synthase subunit HisH [Luminiphilus syltensis]EED35737.1 imidazole glycerol phosphate synthase, glutamine amidotransferase subunit [Luminiphilus syltensis NOR5-1B]